MPNGLLGTQIISLLIYTIFFIFYVLIIISSPVFVSFLFRNTIIIVPYMLCNIKIHGPPAFLGLGLWLVTLFNSPSRHMAFEINYKYNVSIEHNP